MGVAGKVCVGRMIEGYLHACHSVSHEKDPVGFQLFFLFSGIGEVGAKEEKEKDEGREYEKKK